MDQARDQIRDAGGGLVCVFQYRAIPTRNFCRRRGVEVECLGDPERAAYAAVGLERGSLRQYAGPQTWRRYLAAAGAGHVGGGPEGGDVKQMPGTFVVAADGRTALAHYHRESSDNPSTAVVLGAVRDAASGTSPPPG